MKQESGRQIFSWSLAFKIFVAMVFATPFLVAAFQAGWKWTQDGPQVAAPPRRLGPPPLNAASPLPREAHFVSLETCANADYHHNAFLPNPAKGSDHYPGLEAGVYPWGRTVFRIAPSYSQDGKPSVITTGENPAFSCSLPLEPKPSRAVHVALDGAWILDGEARIAQLRIRYEDGMATEKLIVTNQDVWSYLMERTKVFIPAKSLFWESAQTKKIVAVTVPLDRGKKPAALEIQALPAHGIEGKQPAIAIFAVTQELASKGTL